MSDNEEKEPVVAQVSPVEDSHGERPVKCAFCDRPAVTVVEGYPVCTEHAEMIRKGELALPGPTGTGKAPETSEREKL